VPAEESTPAIVLRARDYAESDRIVTLLTRDFGKLSGMAKGAKASRRRFERKLEPFSSVMLFFRRRPHGQLVFITRAEPASTPQPLIDNDLRRIALGSYMLELADALTLEEGEARGAYEVLEAALLALADSSASVALRTSYELRMLQAAGYGIDFDRCRMCGTESRTAKGGTYFIVARGGVVCANCRPEAPQGAVRLDSSSTMSLMELTATPLDYLTLSLSPPSGAAVLAVNRFLANILDRRLRSAEFLDSVL
jgi:DNA repair protein RecO (recombination protein O)